jgi:transcription elongation GreA/GreB family factor
LSKEKKVTQRKRALISEEERRKRELGDLYNKLEYLILQALRGAGQLDRPDEELHRESRVPIVDYVFHM